MKIKNGNIGWNGRKIKSQKLTKKGVYFLKNIKI